MGFPENLLLASPRTLAGEAQGAREEVLPAREDALQRAALARLLRRRRAPPPGRHAPRWVVRGVFTGVVHGFLGFENYAEECVDMYQLVGTV